MPRKPFGSYKDGGCTQEEASFENTSASIATVPVLIHSLNPDKAGEGAGIVICRDGSYPYVNEGAIGDNAFIAGRVVLHGTFDIGASEDLGDWYNDRAD